MTEDFIPISRPHISALEAEYVQKAVASGWVSLFVEYLFGLHDHATKAANTRERPIAVHMSINGQDEMKLVQGENK